MLMYEEERKENFKDDIQIKNKEGLLSYSDFSNRRYVSNEYILEDNIESYFVWIPRYRYQIFNEGKYMDIESEIELADYQNKAPEVFGTKTVNIKDIVCELNNISFGYNKNRLVLKDVNIRIEPKTSIAIVGKSGAGKTSILNLINKLFMPSSGSITLNDIDINDLSEDSLRNNISVVSQHPYLFNMTIKENLKLVKEDASDEEIKRACTLAQIDDDIEKMPKGYNTLIEENGKNLSGGQKQRLAIARVILKDTPIILFDEATSALDNDTEKNLTLALNKIAGKYTIIMVAHRLSTIENCDKIYFLKDSEIIATGTHQELLKKCKPYQELYKNKL